VADHPSNLPASIHQRLLNQAKKQGRPLEELLQYFAIERFLFRLSQSPMPPGSISRGHSCFGFGMRPYRVRRSMWI
jgi:hypothetical protein